MKKIAFMFVAAAMFVACGEKKAAQEAEVAEVEEAAVIDTAAVWALVGDTTGLDAETIAAKFQAVVDSLQAPVADTTATDSTVEAAQ